MEEYREKKSLLLQTRYEMVNKLITKKYGSLDKVPQTGNQPLENKTDRMILDKMINKKTFAVIPVMNDNQHTKLVYTVGCWYYWKTPELVFRFKDNVVVNPEFIHMLVGLVHAELHEMHKDHIEEIIEEKIIVHDYSKDIELLIKKLNITLRLKHINPDGYMEMNTPYMLWFYAFWDQAQLNNKGEIDDIYPVYLIEMDTIEVNKSLDALTYLLIEQMGDLHLDDKKDCKKCQINSQNKCDCKYQSESDDDLPELLSDDVFSDNEYEYEHKQKN